MSEREIVKQSEFYQQRANAAKAGAYYTDSSHCEMIYHLLDFPEEEDVCCLESSIGDANAIIKVTGKNENKNIKIFGVELNRETCKMVMENQLVNEILCGDFLTDVVITQNSFSFAFGNPPYGKSSIGKRMEVLFLKKMLPYLKRDGILVYVIPIYLIKDDEFMNSWSGNFETILKYKFQPYEFRKWQQIVLIGRKRKKASHDRSSLENLRDDILNNIQELPQIGQYNGEKVKVFPSSEQSVKEFSTLMFDVEGAKCRLENSPLRGIIKKNIKVEPYFMNELNRPPILPCQGQMYLLATTGGGQGLVGAEENQDLHLQRGVAKIQKTSSYESNEECERMIEVVRSYTQVSYNIIENNGIIRSLT